jgi:hypothetical protein
MFAAASAWRIFLSSWLRFRTVRHILSLRARIRDEFGKPIVKGYCLIETTPHLHGALFSARGRRERNRRSHHPVTATGPAVMRTNAWRRLSFLTMQVSPAAQR